MQFKTTFTWILGLTFIAYLLFIVLWFTVWGVDPSIWQIILKQWLGMIVFPSACFVALVAVMVLDKAAGNIEFKALGFEFKGAAAPLVMWGMLILIFAIAFKLVWQP